MPITKSAKKALKQDKKKSLYNVKVKTEIKDLIKKSQKLIAEDSERSGNAKHSHFRATQASKTDAFLEKKNKDSAQEKVKAAIKAIDKAVQKKILKKNTGARKKSRLMKKFNQAGKEKK